MTSYSERTSRGLPHTCFFLLSRSNRGRSNRIRKHTGAPNTMARKKASLSLEIQVGKVLVAFFTSSVLPLPFLSTQTANSVVSRGLTKCTVFTIGNEKKKKKTRHGNLPEDAGGATATTLTLSCTQTFTHLCTKIHSVRQVTPVTAPIRNGYFINKFPLHFKREYGEQTLKKIKSAVRPLEFFHSEPRNISLGAVHVHSRWPTFGPLSLIGSLTTGAKPI